MRAIYDTCFQDQVILMWESGLSASNDPIFLCIACECFSERWHVRREGSGTEFSVSACDCLSGSFPYISVVSPWREKSRNELFSCRIEQPRIVVGLFIAITETPSCAVRHFASRSFRPVLWRSRNTGRRSYVRFQKFNL